MPANPPSTFTYRLFAYSPVGSGAPTSTDFDCLGAQWRLGAISAPWTAAGHVFAAADAAYVGPGSKCPTPAGTRVRWAAVPLGLRAAPRKLVVTDVDSTLIAQEVIELIAAHAGKEAEIREITEAAMRGELDFAASLTARLQQLAGLDAGILAQVREEVRLSPGAEELVRRVHDSGGVIGAVSGGFSAILDRLAASLGLDFALANELAITAEGTLAGTVTGGVVDRERKAQALRDWAAASDIPLEASVAVGDGANDLAMLATAGLGVAYRAKPVVAEAADIAVDRLDVLAELLF